MLGNCRIEISRFVQAVESLHFPVDNVINTPLSCREGNSVSIEVAFLIRRQCRSIQAEGLEEAEQVGSR